MYFEFLLFTRRCFPSVSSASLAISKTDDVITENGFFFFSFFFCVAGSQAQAYDRPGTVLQQSGCFFFLPPPLPLLALLVYYTDASLTMTIENATE